MIFLSLFIIFLSILAIIPVLLFLYSTLIIRRPFVPVSKKLIPQIIEALDIKEGGITYDLGCGDGRVLKACYENQPQAYYIGLDKDISCFFLSWLRCKFLNKSNNISIFRKDLFKHNLSDATNIFIYLYPDLIQKLAPKLEKEIMRGTKLVSCDFPLPGMDPIKVIDLHKNRPTVVRKLFVYIF